MTYLQQALEARRMVRREPEDYAVSSGGSAPAVSLQLPSGETWVFLWSTLVSALYDAAEGREMILLSFLHHVVKIEGQNLDRVVADIGDMRLRAVRVGESIISGHSETGKTAISSIIVESLNAPTPSDLGGRSPGV